MGEEWRPIPGHEGYEASSTGAIRSLRRLTPHVLRPWTHKTGHLSVSLGRGHKHTVHSLVALTFHGPRPAGLDIRHLNSDPADNRPENLAYGTRSENQRDSVLAGTHPHAKKTHCPRGHEYTPENIRPTAWANGIGRACRSCEPIRAALRKATAA